MSQQSNKSAIGIGGVVNIVITLFSIPFAHNEQDETGLMGWIITGVLIGIYLFSALSTLDVDTLVQFSGHALEIYDESDMDDVEKVLVIKDQLTIFNDLYVKIFTEVRELIKGKPSHASCEEIKTLVNRTLKGKVTKGLAAWIFLYMGYRILIQTNFIQIPLPYNMLVSVGFVMLLELTKKGSSGIGEVVMDMIKVLKPFTDELVNKLGVEMKTTEKDVRLALRTVVHDIRLLCFRYKNIAAKIEEKYGKSVGDVLIGTTESVKA